jgi:hypothetical protein
MAAKKKLAPCSKYMHHVFLPLKKDLVAKGLEEAEQTCKFCEAKRTIKLKSFELLDENLEIIDEE